jgi:hypothetical protein
MAATFEFAEKLMQAKDATEVMRLQSDYLGGRCRRFQPGPGAWTKCCQNGGGWCQTSAVIPAQRTPPDKI